VYIYQFVSYDTTLFFLNDAPNKRERIAVNATSDYLTTSSSDILIVNSIDVRTITSIVTSAVARFSALKIAGESIQRRISSENILEMLKSSNYPVETDFIIIGEINILRGNSNSEPHYEIDLKILDVSRQEIINSSMIALSKPQINDLRNLVDQLVEDVVGNLISPFVSNIFLATDSTSTGKILWDTCVLRPVDDFVGSKKIQTDNKDYELVQQEPVPDPRISPALRAELARVNFNFGYDEIRLVKSVFDRYRPDTFLQGKYLLSIQVINNGVVEQFMREINLVALRPGIIQIHLEIPPPPVVVPVSGNLKISNLPIDVVMELLKASPTGQHQIDRVISTAKELDGHCENPDIKTEYNIKNRTVQYEGLYEGTYVLSTYGQSKVFFPGKQSVDLYSYTDTIKIDSAQTQHHKTLFGKNELGGREVVIYFNPFPNKESDTYKLFIQDSNSPIANVKNAGELHVFGVPTDFNGTFRVFKDEKHFTTLNIPRGGKKIYLNADLENETLSEVKPSDGNNEPEPFYGFFKRE
ncbi:MAG: hypothetical protein K9M19_00945, partial [Candidatus Marinimicrobia bacterium]|nr:hypothetical protein [Candidatus Neomarinimicrobiota bacterium]